MHVSCLYIGSRVRRHDVNPLKGSGIRWSHFKAFSAIQVYIFNFRHSGTLALMAERQSARMSEIKNVG